VTATSFARFASNKDFFSNSKSDIENWLVLAENLRVIILFKEIYILRPILRFRYNCKKTNIRIWLFLAIFETKFAKKKLSRAAKFQREGLPFLLTPVCFQ